MDINTAADAVKNRLSAEPSIFSELLDFYFESHQDSKHPEKIVVATGPLCPVEAVFAANAFPYDIVTRSSLNAFFNGIANLHQQAIDAQISPEFSPWNLIMLGSVLTNLENSHIDLYSTSFMSDEQLTKSFQLVAQMHQRPLHIWEVPNYNLESKAWSLEYLKKELQLLFEWLAKYTGNRVTESNLAEAIHWSNLVKNDMAEIDTYLATKRVPISGLEYYILQVMLGDCAQDPQGLHELLRKLIDQLKFRPDQRISASGSTSPVRIYLVGDETQELQIYNIIEENGGMLVGCNFRLPLYYRTIEETGKPLDSLVRWIWNMPNNLPTKERISSEYEFIKNQQPDAIIVNSTVGSRCMPGVEKLYRELIKQEMEIPVLCVETTLSGENVDKIDYQIKALLQTINANY